MFGMIVLMLAALYGAMASLVMSGFETLDLTGGMTVTG
jgi:hypothetical protein